MPGKGGGTGITKEREGGRRERERNGGREGGRGEGAEGRERE